jgi:hypothetical protein
MSDELRAIVGTQIRWNSPTHHRFRQRFDYFLAAQPSCHRNGQALPREFIDRVSSRKVLPSCVMALTKS